jgi:hypothetical protein
MHSDEILLGILSEDAIFYEEKGIFEEDYGRERGRGMGEENQSKKKSEKQRNKRSKALLALLLEIETAEDHHDNESLESGLTIVPVAPLG